MGGLMYGIEGLASLNVIHGQPQRAAQLFAWAEATRKKMNIPRPPLEQKSVDRDLALLRSQWDETEFAKLLEEARAMTIEQAIAFALEPV
jgi:hypothetical protein